MTVGEMAKRLGVAPSTLRYYDKEGLLPFVDRTESGIRIFKEEDYEWLQIIGCLKKTGMKLKEIREFVCMAMQGDETIEPRLALIKARRAEANNQIAELREILNVLDFKCWYYETAKGNGTTKILKNMCSDEFPQEFRDVRRKLKGE